MISVRGIIMAGRLSVLILIGAMAVSTFGCAALSYAQEGKMPDLRGKKVLYIDSYHPGYGWSDGVTAGVVSGIGGNKAQLKIHSLDTKRNQSVEFCEQAALKAKALIEEYKPDVVIAADDNASRYLVVPYYKDSDIPFIFVGVNWDASSYGYPFKNTTGMIEVNAVDELIDLILHMTERKKIGVLTSDVETEYKENSNVKKKLGIEFAEEAYVLTFDAWKKAYLDLQDKVDILLVQNNAGIQDWNHEEAMKFAYENVKVPTGTVNTYMAPYVMLGYAKLPEEQGEWAAQTALEILSGKSPSDIPMTKNVKGKVYANPRMADKLNIEIPTDVLQVAEIIE